MRIKHGEKSLGEPAEHRTGEEGRGRDAGGEEKGEAGGELGVNSTERNTWGPHEWAEGLPGGSDHGLPGAGAR